MQKLSAYAFPSTGMECYYFTDKVDNAIDILEHSHLFGSFPSRVNDPNDLRIQIVGWEKNVGRILENIDRASFERNLNKALSEKGCMDRSMRILCMAKAAKVDVDAEAQKMFWEKYAGKGFGVRFKFLVDSSFLIQPHAKEVFFDDVNYEVRVKELDASAIHADCDIAAMIGSGTFLRDLCYSKETKWCKEYEVRFVAPYTRLNLQMSSITSREERYFVFNPKNLLEVRVGKAVCEVDFRTIQLSLNRYNLQLQKM